MLIKLLSVFPLRKLGRNGDYLHRWLIVRFKKFRWIPRVFLHRFLASDSAHELHNHPFSGFSIILYGSYREERLHENSIKAKIFRFLDMNIIKRNTFHRVDLLSDEVWTLFITGPLPKDYQWGFIDRNTLEYLDSEKYITDGSLLEDID